MQIFYFYFIVPHPYEGTSDDQYILDNALFNFASDAPSSRGIAYQHTTN